jgi:hypothetical protein
MKHSQFASLAGAVLCCLLSEFAFSQNQPSENAQRNNDVANTSTAVAAASKLPDLTVGDGQSRPKRLPGYYVIFEKNDSGWTIRDINTASREISDFANREVLYFSKDLTYVDPEFKDAAFDPQTGQFKCMGKGLKTSRGEWKRNYNPCQSSLTTTMDDHLGVNATMAVVTLGLNLLAGAVARDVRVDKGKVLDLVQQTDILERLRKTNAAEDLLAYRQAFERAKSAGALAAFINRYSNNDPEALVPQAIERRQIVVANDYRRGADASTSAALDAYIQRFQGNDPDNLIPKAIQRRDQLRIEEYKAAENLRIRLAADEEQRRKQEMEYRNKMLSTLKTPGTKICNGYEGNLERHTGAVMMGNIPVMEKIPGRYTVMATTEGASGSRLQFRVSTIYHTSTSGATTTMNALTVGSNTFQPGAVAWDDISNWIVCM